MPQFTKRDLATILLLTGLAVFAMILALLGNVAWTLVVIAGMVALCGVISRVEFATRRNDLRAGRKASRDHGRVLATIERATRAGARSLDQLALNDANHGQVIRRLEIAASSDHRASLEADFAAIAGQLSSLQAEIRGMRVAHQLTSQTITATKTDLVKSTESTAHLVDDVQALHQLFSRFTPTAPLPSLSSSGRGAANSYLLVDAIEQRKATCVTHRGSRASSLWMAYALRRRGHGSVVVLDDDEESAEQTRAMFAEHDLIGWGEARVVPRATDTSRGTTLAEQYADGFGDRRCIDLLVLDMSSASAAAGDWYPSAAALQRILIPGARVIVFDAQRADVREVIRLWEESIPALVRFASSRKDTAVLAWETATD